MANPKKASSHPWVITLSAEDKFIHNQWGCFLDGPQIHISRRLAVGVFCSNDIIRSWRARYARDFLELGVIKDSMIEPCLGILPPDISSNSNISKHVPRNFPKHLYPILGLFHMVLYYHQGENRDLGGDLGRFLIQDWRERHGKNADVI